MGRRRIKIALLTALGSAAALAAATGLVLLQPRWLVAVLAQTSPRVVYFVETERPAVALTIDDGPDGPSTRRILDVLERYEARATFFLISDRVAGDEELVEEMVAAGHELGNHMKRDRPSIELSPAEFEAALLEADSVLSRFAELRWARPGSGWYDGTMLSIMEKHGYRCALGSIYPYDALIRSPAFAVHHVLRKARPGSVIVLHDWATRGARTAAALEDILPELRRRGLEVVTLSELWAGSGRQ